MEARRAVRSASKSGRSGRRGNDASAVDEVKQALGERGPVWWDDGSPDFNRPMAKDTLYAAWYAKLARPDQGGL
jgi:hypothetical protein